MSWCKGFTFPKHPITGLQDAQMIREQAVFSTRRGYENLLHTLTQHGAETRVVLSNRHWSQPKLDYFTWNYFTSCSTLVFGFVKITPQILQPMVSTLSHPFFSFLMPRNPSQKGSMVEIPNKSHTKTLELGYIFPYHNST